MEVRFHSKIDRWLLVLILGGLALGWLACLPTFLDPNPVRSIIAVGSVLFATVFIGWVFWTTDYRVTPHVIIIRSGPFRWRIAIDEIIHMEPTRNPLSSPALSLDRLRIDYGKGKFIMISPVDKQAFMEAVESRRSDAGSR